MPLDQQAKARLQKLQNEATDILSELSDIFPDHYRFTFVARHHDNVDDEDIVLTTDVIDEAIGALERNKLKMENAG